MMTRNKWKLPRAPKRITPAFGFSYIAERAIREGLGRRQFGDDEMAKVVEWFAQYEPQPACVFCGSPDVRRWDHLIPIREDGETVLGNMALACQPCDDSKGKKPFEEWMSGTAEQSPKNRSIANVDERIKRLKAYMKAFGYAPLALESRLTAEERTRLSGVRSGLEAMKKKAEGLIQDFQERTGSG